MKKLYIIDASGVIYRAYFAIRGMTNDEGKSTNALYGFIRSLLKLFKDVHPDHCVAVFDGPHNSRTREEIYPAYKGHRAAMPPDLIYQMGWAREFCRLYGISLLDVEGVEADDTMASVAVFADSLGCHSYLCSSDKDLYQLVNDQISILDMYKENLVYTAKEVEEKFGVPPALIVDYLSLLGDSSDNVPGVPGIGAKSAVELLKEFGSLDALLANLDKISAKKKQETLKNHRDDALLSKKLVSLDKEIDFPREEAFFLLKPPLHEELKAFFASMKFLSLIKELSQEAPPLPQTTSNRYHLACGDLSPLMELLKKQKEVAIATKTTSLDPMRGQLVGVSVAFSPDEAWYIPMSEKALKPLQELFSSNIGFYGHNIKYDAHVLFNAGMPIKNIVFDTLLASFTLHAHSRKHSLENLALEHFNVIKSPLAPLLGKGKSQITLAEVPASSLAPLACEDADHIVRLKALLEPELETRGLSSLYHDLELPLLTVLFKMELAGIFLDVPRLQEFGEWLGGEIQTISSAIYEEAGEEFNLNSPLQVSKALFEKMGLKAPKGSSTSADVLEELAEDYPIAKKILDYRGVEKLRSTYVDALPQTVHPKTHRIHCTFNQSVAATGRLSCQDPNLQNIPVRTELGLKIREAFRPQKEGWSFIAADYSQIELRLLAHLSEDPALVDAFQSGEDIHAHTASKVFHVPLDLVTKEMRSRAKAVNFGIIYGQGAFGLSQGLGISQKEAAEFITMYFQQYPKVKTFLEGCKDYARIHGKAVTITGRERLIPEILSPNIQIRNAAERLAVNTPFQGSAADLIKKAMLDIEKTLDQVPHVGFMILQIHDELIFEAPDHEIDFFKHLIKDKMEQVIQLKVPLIVDIGVGKNWKEC
jgi:DNA polymerase I